METTLEIRDAVQADGAAIAAIYNAHIDRRDCTMDLEHWQADVVTQRIVDLDPREAWIVAAEQDAVVGWGAVRKYSPRAGYRNCCETSIYVAPDVTGQGIGQRLIEALLSECQSLGYHLVVVRIFADNRRSRAFHERNGFSTVGILHEAGQINGQWIDVAILQRLIPSGDLPSGGPTVT